VQRKQPPLPGKHPRLGAGNGQDADRHDQHASGVDQPGTAAQQGRAQPEGAGAKRGEGDAEPDHKQRRRAHRPPGV